MRLGIDFSTSRTIILCHECCVYFPPNGSSFPCDVPHEHEKSFYEYISLSLPHITYFWFSLNTSKIIIVHVAW